MNANTHYNLSIIMDVFQRRIKFVLILCVYWKKKKNRNITNIRFIEFLKIIFILYTLHTYSYMIYSFIFCVKLNFKHSLIRHLALIKPIYT